MRSKVSLLLFMVIGLVIIYSCKQEPKTEEKNTPKTTFTKNPNGDSELALLMREMYLELEQVQSQIEKGEPVRLQVDHESILTAHASEPEKAASPEFKAFAKQYLIFVEQMKSAKPAELEVYYQNLISSCLSCHQMLCPGPMVRINKLKIQE